LIGIFESKTIWATSIQHLNDSEEYVHAARLLRKELEQRLDKETGSKKQLIADWLETPEEKGRSFITSFSQKSDLLSQWRAYANCDDAYSLSFNSEEISSILKDPNCALVKCVYKIEQQKELLNQLVDYLHKMITRWSGLKGSRWWAWMGRMNRVVEGVLAAMKNPSFEEEQEWRIVTSVDVTRTMHFRPGRFGVVPFYKLPLMVDENGKLSFAEMMIGPTQDRKAAEFAVDKLVHSYGIPHKTPLEKRISHSISSFRP